MTEEPSDIGVARVVYGDAGRPVKRIPRAVAGRVDDLGDDPIRRDLEGVATPECSDVGVARVVYGDADRAVNRIPPAVASLVDDLGDAPLRRDL
ncbi:MAG: hypothetical protein ACYTFA_10650, partial [Planctomycetota bacterium]